MQGCHGKKLQEAEASETSIRSELEAAKTSASQQMAAMEAMEAKLQEFEASHTALTSELQRSRAAEAASVELNGELMNQMQDADDRASSLTVELIAAKDSPENYEGKPPILLSVLTPDCEVRCCTLWTCRLVDLFFATPCCFGVFPQEMLGCQRLMLLSGRTACARARTLRSF